TSSTRSSKSGRGSPSMLNSISGLCCFSHPAISVTSAGRMCRPSARGCTVIPGAPAATAISTARSTLGSSPPRELRSVAILLTLTEREIMTRQRQVSLPQRSPDRVCDLFGPRLHGRLIASFDHDAQQRLGPGVTDEEATL